MVYWVVDVLFSVFIISIASLCHHHTLSEMIIQRARFVGYKAFLEE